MDAIIDVVLEHPVVLFYLILGISLILYSCFAKRMSFQGDVPSWPDERETYEATPRMRLYGVALGMLPLLYGLYQLLTPVIMNGKGGHAPQ
jgi:hypothetical protein